VAGGKPESSLGKLSGYDKLIKLEHDRQQEPYRVV
jgi:hypothetical protein